MPTEHIVAPSGLITVDDIHNALNLVVFDDPKRIERPAPPCDYPRICAQSCKYPRYHRDGKPEGLVAEILFQLGYPISLLKSMDMQYELGEVLHPGVKISRCRDQALRRIERGGMHLLAFLQAHQDTGLTWAQISVEAFRPRRMIGFLDARRRPWLY